MNRIVIILSALIWATAIQAADFVPTRIDDPAPDGCQVDDCSLREAVLDANANPGEDTIVLANDIYLLLRQGLDDLGISGDLDITDDLIIQGTQNPDTGERTRIDVHLIPDRVLDVHAATSLTIRDAAIRGGDSADAGGGIRAINAELELQRVQVGQNRSADGGGIYAMNSNLRLIDVRLYENVSDSTGGGGGLSQIGGSLFIINNVIEFNEGGLAGGLSIQDLDAAVPSVSTEIIGSEVIANRGNTGPGGISLTDLNGQFTALISDSRINDNFGVFGGGLRVSGVGLVIEGSGIDGNTAIADGGGIYTDTIIADHSEGVTIRSSMISRNTAFDEAAALYSFMNLTLTNVTVSGNQTFSGHGIVLGPGMNTLSHVTIAENEQASQRVLNSPFNGSVLRMVNTIISGECAIGQFSTMISLGWEHRITRRYL